MVENIGILIYIGFSMGFIILLIFALRSTRKDNNKTIENLRCKLRYYNKENDRLQDIIESYEKECIP